MPDLKFALFGTGFWSNFQLPARQETARLLADSIDITRQALISALENIPQQKE